VLQAGELDLKVDWEGTYYNWIDNPTFSSNDVEDPAVVVEDGPNLVDQPGPIINLQDVKPGDVLEVTQSAHIFGNPAFLGWHYEEHADTDNGITEPEDKVNGHDPDQSDGTEDGDLDEYLQVVIWYDDGDNLPDEVLPIDEDDDGELDIPEEEYVMDVASIQSAADAFGGADPVVYAGNLAGLDGADVRFDARNSNSGEVAEDFPDTACYQNSITEYVAVLVWLPTDIPGVNDNIVQTDRLEFQFGFDAIQCRHNVGNDGLPMDDTIADADAENNANSPEGDEGGVVPEEAVTAGDGWGKLQFGDEERTWFGRLRHGGTGSQLYVGHEPGDVSQGSYSWGGSFDGSFSLTYDADADEGTLRLYDDTDTEVSSTTYTGLDDPASTDDGSADELAITTKAYNSGNEATVSNLMLNGSAVGPPSSVSSAAEGPTFLHISGVDVTPDWELTGDVSFTFADPQDEDPTIDISID